MDDFDDVQTLSMICAFHVKFKLGLHMLHCLSTPKPSHNINLKPPEFLPLHVFLVNEKSCGRKVKTLVLSKAGNLCLFLVDFDHFAVVHYTGCLIDSVG